MQETEFLNFIKEQCITATTGVPCSSLSALFHKMEQGNILSHIGTTTEGEAVGFAAGAWMSGKRAAIFCQNSGIGNMINPLTSLNAPYGIPADIFVSMRGAPGYRDEPQHEIMGAFGGKFLKLAGVKTSTFPKNDQQLRSAFKQATEHFENRIPHAYLIEPQTFKNAAVASEAYQKNHEKPKDVHINRSGKIVSRMEAIEIFSTMSRDHLFVATTGMTSRELYALRGDCDDQFLMAGSMGHASAIGLGLSFHSNKPVIVLDGDGAFLMKAGNSATIGRYAPPGFTHIVLDNGVHGSTGGNINNARHVDFASIARASGYETVFQCEGESSIEKVCSDALSAKGPIFIHCIVSPEEKITAQRPAIDLRDHALSFRHHVMNLEL